MDFGNLGQNLVKGFANAAGAPEVAQSIDKKQDEQRKNQMQMQVAPLSQALQADQVRLALYADPKDPTKALPEHQAEYDATMARMENTIGQMRSVLGQPAPHKNLADRLHIGRDLSSRTQQYQNQSKQMAGEYAAGALPYEVTPEGQKATLAHKNAMELAEITHPEKPEAENWGQIDLKFRDGTSRTVEHNSKNGKYRTLGGRDLSPEELDGAVSVPKPSSAGPVIAFKKGTDGKITSFLLDRTTKQPIPGTENPDIIPPAYLVSQLSTGVYHWVDDNNNIHETPESHTRTPILPGGNSSPQKVTPTGDKPKATGPGHAAVTATKDRILGKGKPTADVITARKGYEEAVGLASMADEVAKNPNDAINQKRLAVQLERLSAGRFTTQALSYVIKAGWGNTIQQWLSNPSTGALPPDVMRQLVDGAHQYLNEKKATLDAAQNMSGGGPSSGGGGNKHKIKIGNKFYTYNGTGDTADLKNYTEVN